MWAGWWPAVGDKVHLEPTSELQLCVGPSGGLGLRDGWEAGPAAQGVWWKRPAVMSLVAVHVAVCSACAAQGAQAQKPVHTPHGDGDTWSGAYSTLCACRWTRARRERSGHRWRLSERHSHEEVNMPGAEMAWEGRWETEGWIRKWGPDPKYLNVVCRLLCGRGDLLGKTVSLVEEVGSGSRGRGEWRKRQRLRRAARRRARKLLQAELRRPEQAVVAGEGPVARGRECPVRDTEWLRGLGKWETSEQRQVGGGDHSMRLCWQAWKTWCERLEVSQTTGWGWVGRGIWGCQHEAQSPQRHLTNPRVGLLEQV